MLRSTAVVASASVHHDAEALLGVLRGAPFVRTETTQPSITCLVFAFGVGLISTASGSVSAARRRVGVILTCMSSPASAESTSTEAPGIRRVTGASSSAWTGAAFGASSS